MSCKILGGGVGSVPTVLKGGVDTPVQEPTASGGYLYGERLL